MAAPGDTYRHATEREQCTTGKLHPSSIYEISAPDCPGRATRSGASLRRRAAGRRPMAILAQAVSALGPGEYNTSIYRFNRLSGKTMMGPHGTIQLLLAGYMALLMPLCCCYGSVAPECSAPTGKSTIQSQTRPEHNHREHAHEHDGGHEHQAPADDHHKCGTSCPGHDDGSCDCGCDNPGHHFFTVEQSVSIDTSLGFSHVVLPWLTLALTKQVGPNRPATSPPHPPTSLVRMHCALIV